MSMFEGNIGIECNLRSILKYLEITVENTLNFYVQPLLLGIFELDITTYSIDR